jgi:predicted RNA-binding Zn ribbon-like protein
MFADYDEAGVALALGLANTRPVDPWPDELTEVRHLQERLDRAGVEGRATKGDLEHARALRWRIAEVLDAGALEPAVAVVDALLDEAGVRPRLVTGGDHAHLHLEPADGDLRTRLTARVAVSLAAVLAESGVERFGVCADQPACSSFFLDTSRNASRRFCSQTCSTRSAVRAHRARARQQRG